MNDILGINEAEGLPETTTGIITSLVDLTKAAQTNMACCHKRYMSSSPMPIGMEYTYKNYTAKLPLNIIHKIC